MAIPDAQLWTDSQFERNGVAAPTLSDAELMPPPSAIPPLRKRSLAILESSIPMKKKIKTWNSRSFCFTESENNYIIINSGEPAICSLTVYNDLAVHNVNKEDRKKLNIVTQAMLRNADLYGMIWYLDEEEEKKTLFLKFDKKSKIFDNDGNPIQKPPTRAFKAKVSLRLLGIFKKDNIVKPMFRVHQIKVTFDVAIISRFKGISPPLLILA